jgi:radical SAM protein with 4Fe4S-binding SPASM domain
LNAFDRLNERNIPIGVITTLLDFNFYDLNDMCDLLAESGVDIWQLQLAHPMGNMKEDFVLNPDKIPLLTKFIKDIRYSQKIIVYAADNIGYYDENEAYIRSIPGNISVWQGCQAGLSVIGIDSVGNVKGCESIYSEDLIEGNLREKSLSEIWNDEDNFSYNRKFRAEYLDGNCKACKMGEICRGGCRGSNLFCSGNLYENYFCQYNKKQKS